MSNGQNGAEGGVGMTWTKEDTEALAGQGALGGNRPCSGSPCPDPGLGRECHCRAKRGFKFASDDWCSCACHRNYPQYFREGEWCLDESEDADAAVVTYSHEPSPETGHVGWVWWALGAMGDAPSLDEAKRLAEQEIARSLDWPRERGAQ